MTTNDDPGALTCAPAADLDDNTISELTISGDPAQVPAGALDAALAHAAETGAERVVTSVPAGSAATEWLSREGFTKAGQVARWTRAAGAAKPDQVEGRFEVRPYAPGDYTADALVGLAAATMGTLVFTAPELLTVRDNTLRTAVFGGTTGQVFAAFDGWMPAGWIVLSGIENGSADIVLAQARPDLAGQGMLGQLLAPVVTLADEQGIALRVSVDPDREKELTEALGSFGFTEGTPTEVWQRTLPVTAQPAETHEVRRELEPLRGTEVALVTTFKKDGTGKGTPVGITVGPDRAFFTTRSQSWKVKRIANNKNVVAAPSDPMGTPTGASVELTARRMSDAEVLELRKGVQYHVWRLIYHVAYADEPVTYELTPRA
ncbi:MAG TPA: pyridoxamine 5'-phosphate oxidase family protein [Pseudonocardiaceae bacterium]|nr:pyridoxamine 5'-phosphate oxidase family protein [Pseudonocardiaceae bacterium]